MFQAHRHVLTCHVSSPSPRNNPSKLRSGTKLRRSPTGARIHPHCPIWSLSPKEISRMAWSCTQATRSLQGDISLLTTLASSEGRRGVRKGHTLLMAAQRVNSYFYHRGVVRFPYLVLRHQ